MAINDCLILNSTICEHFCECVLLTNGTCTISSNDCNSKISIMMICIYIASLFIFLVLIVTVIFVVYRKYSKRKEYEEIKTTHIRRSSYVEIPLT